jgi:hypothetical protein
VSGTNGPFGFAEGNTIGDDTNAFSFLVKQMLGRTATSAMVQILSCTNSGGVSKIGTVNVQPMVNQIDGVGNAMPHKPINNLPYFRMVGGTNAVIMDPQPGDIGIASFFSRDSSSAIASGKQSNPGSWRRYDWADGVYLGCILNGIPTQYIQFLQGGAGINILSPGTVTITAPTTAIEGNLTVSGTTIGTGSGTFNTVIVDLHVHTSEVGPGSSETGAPVPGT